MANSTISITFKVDDKNHSFKVLAKDADGLKKALSSTVSEAENLHNRVLRWANAANAARAFGGVINQLQSTFKSLTDAYAIQEQAETQLATVMRNTMGAADAQIESILRLTSAQQKLGVIGDEVQLAGAQKLAGFLREKESLEALIPVMNDMVAGQYGLKASGENAAAVATLLGKAMNGQASALSRIGITFTDLQKQVLQYGSESEKVAVLTEVLQARFGGLNQELANTASGRLQQISNWFGDIRESLGKVVQGAMPILSVLAQMTTAAASLGTLSASLKAVCAAFNLAAIKAKLAAVTQKLYTAVTAKATAATVAFKVALGGVITAVATGLVVGITALIRKTKEAKQTTDEFSGSMEDLGGTSTATRAALEMDIAKLGAFNGSATEQNRLVKEMNDRWGESFGHFKTTAEWYEVLSKNIDIYCSKLAKQSAFEAAANRVANAKNDYDEANDRINFLHMSGKAVRRGIFKNTLTPEVQALIEKRDAAKKTIEEGEAKMQGLLSEISELSNQLPTVVTPKTTEGLKNLSGDIENYRQSVQRAIEVNQAFASGKDDETVKLDAMQSGLTSLINKYGLESEAVRTLLAEYNALVAARIRAHEERVGDRLPVLTGPVSKASTDLGKGLVSTQPLKETIKVSDMASEALSGLSGMLSELSGAVGESAASWMNWTSNLLQSVARAIPALTALAGAEAAASAAKTPIVGAIAAVAAMSSVVAAFASLPKFATGGLVYGPTLGLMGEYPGASSNPEVVGKLSDIRKYIDRPAMPDLSGIKFRIEGRDLVAILGKETNLRGRS